MNIFDFILSEIKGILIGPLHLLEGGYLLFHYIFQLPHIVVDLWKQVLLVSLAWLDCV